MLALSFLSVITLALAVNAYKSHLQQANRNHHELAAAAAGRCRTPPTRQSSSSADLVTQSALLVGAALPTGIPVSASEAFPSYSKSWTTIVVKPTPPPSSTHVHTEPVHDNVLPTAVPAPVASTAAPDIGEEKVAATSKTSAFTPNGIKAGIAGGDSYPYVKDHIGWWYDWSPTPSKSGKPIGVPMLWGGGTADATDAARLKAFQQLKTVPVYVLGFEEPDCAPGSGSAGMTVDAAVSKWEQLMAPLKAKGAKLGSPSMCKQADETWLAEFAKKIKTPWDITAIHVNKNSLDGVKKDIDHYKKYGKPIWVTEFACVADNPNFVPCTNQAQINKFIQDIVPFLESHPDIYAYAYSNGLGLGNVWPMTTSDGKLSASGKAYLDAISKFH
ncbi:hypothetical protein EST38_g8023 [Candolleomyces aberdarensis]|uniref:Asl1-like glycosyl hydrolase catalytic domain-containing protein n=1 Tax=Candolleomyces aberdarensis TaxID=2316362 RepID=A0A4Q2DDR8_9AGAR|nr:hypothetical protein EST38_g8023 [Candolleomyces aberdarensis]